LAFGEPSINKIEVVFVPPESGPVVPTETPNPKREVVPEVPTAF